MKNFKFRVVTVRYIDSLFYENGDSRYCHKKANDIFTQQLCGIGGDRHLDFVNMDPEELAGYDLTEDVKLMLWLLVRLYKLMPRFEMIRFLKMFRCAMERAEKTASRDGRKLSNADRLFAYLFAEIGKAVVK